MKELTIEHLAAYLPYGASVMKQGFFPPYGFTKQKLTGISIFNLSRGEQIILRPLSQDTINRICEKHDLDFTFNMSMQNLMVDPNFDNVPYFIIKELLSEHVDIFCLIENGLAIDINTLK